MQAVAEATFKHFNKATTELQKALIHSFFFFPITVCAITASGVPGGTFVSMNHFSTLCG